MKRSASTALFNAEFFVAPPHAVAMEFDLFGERRSDHSVKGGGLAKVKMWADRIVPSGTPRFLIGQGRALFPQAMPLR
jgi:hypothetical protein